MAQHLGTEIVEMVWQKPLHELDGDVLRKEAHRRLESIAAMAERECSDLASYVEAIREGDLWLKLADDWETLCLEYFRRPAQFVDNVVVGVRALREQGHQGPITSEEATKAAVAIARRQTDPADPEFVRHGGNRRGEGFKIGNTKLERESANSKPGTLRRLSRSRPDLLARVESGELSAHAAAVQAGIRKPMRSIPVDTPEAAIRALLRVFTVTDLAQALGKAAEVSPPS